MPSASSNGHRKPPNPPSGLGTMFNNSGSMSSTSDGVTNAGNHQDGAASSASAGASHVLLSSPAAVAGGSNNHNGARHSPPTDSLLSIPGTSNPAQQHSIGGAAGTVGGALGGGAMAMAVDGEGDRRNSASTSAENGGIRDDTQQPLSQDSATGGSVGHRKVGRPPKGSHRATSPHLSHSRQPAATSISAPPAPGEVWADPLVVMEDFAQRVHNLKCIYAKAYGVAIPAERPPLNLTQERAASLVANLVFVDEEIPCDPNSNPPDASEMTVNLPILPSTEIFKLGEYLQLEIVALPTDSNIKTFMHGHSWPADWSGSLNLWFKDVLVLADPASRGGNPNWHEEYKHVPDVTSSTLRTLCQQNNKLDDFVPKPFSEYYLRNWKLLIRFFALVSHLPTLPTSAKRILQRAASRPSISVDEKYGFMTAAVKAVNYCRRVLREDGWVVDPAPHKLASPPALLHNLMLAQPATNVGELADATSVALSSDKATAISDASWSGPSYIGSNITWEGSDGVVVAYIRDDDIGDLWKMMYTDDFETCDLEHSELVKGLRAFERKNIRKKRQREIEIEAEAGLLSSYASDNVYSKEYKRINGGKNPPGRPPKNLALGGLHAGGKRGRWAIVPTGDPNFDVAGAEYGVVQARSYNPAARQHLYWPARIVHFGESKRLTANAPSWEPDGTLSKKKLSASKDEGVGHVALVFFSPYWTENTFEVELVDCVPNSIQEFILDPRSVEEGRIDFGSLRSFFNFTGLPKKDFSRYVNAHRLATGFKYYASNALANGSDSPVAAETAALASLRDCHVLSSKTFCFHPCLLNMPWDAIISCLPPVRFEGAGSAEAVNSEPILNLHSMLAGLLPPSSLVGAADDRTAGGSGGGRAPRRAVPVAAENPLASLSFSGATSSSSSLSSAAPDHLHFSVETIFPKDVVEIATSSSSSSQLPVPPEIRRLWSFATDVVNELHSGVSLVVLNSASVSRETRVATLRRMLPSILHLKGHGESVITTTYPLNSSLLVKNWGRGCESLFKVVRSALSVDGIGDHVSAVLTDEKCRGHLTKSGCFERSVRLPAALKGAKNAGAGKSPDFLLEHSVSSEYEDLALRVLPMVHERSYLDQLRKTISFLTDDSRGEPLTDDSDGEGGNDTGGSKGSYVAAVSAVACSLKAVDMVVRGEAVNVFCATRPPGHHAGTNVRSMDAPSNGFCLLNSAASAAKYATGRVEDGGLGLKRVAVIDFDVHHGNGTQDVLCKTYDPQFLYISMHAGGEGVNVGGGAGGGGGSQNTYAHLGNSGRKDRKDGDNAIFPGRCGNYSPHPGVLNIPMGDKVTASAVSAALNDQVKKALDSFAPDLIVLSAGFDAHKNDPLGLGGLTASDFGAITTLCIVFAESHCSGRVVSILEGGYGVPCCKFTKQNLFLPPSEMPAAPQQDPVAAPSTATTLFPQTVLDSRLVSLSITTRAKLGLVDDPAAAHTESFLGPLGADDMPTSLMRDLLPCAEEGFIECVQAHCSAMWQGAKTKK